MALERLLLDGWEITEGVVRGWEYRSGMDKVAQSVGTNVTVPNRSGEIWRRKALGPGMFTINLWLAGADQNAVQNGWRDLIRAAQRPHRLVTATRYMASGEIVTAQVELAGGMEPTFLGQRGVRAALDFKVPSGVWQSQQTYSSATTPGTGAHILNLTDHAPSTAVMEDLVYEVKGAATNPVVADWTDGVAGDQFTYNGPITTGQSIVVNSGSWSVTGTGGLTPNAAAMAPTGPRLMSVPAARPGQTPQVRLTGTGFSSKTQLIVTGKRSFAC